MHNKQILNLSLQMLNHIFSLFKWVFIYSMSIIKVIFVFNLYFVSNINVNYLDESFLGFSFKTNVLKPLKHELTNTKA